MYKNEKYLLKKSANERSLTHKLAEYLQSEFPEYNVDCEYNLDIDSQSKKKKWVSNEVKEKLEKIIEEIKNDLKPLNYDLSEEVKKLSLSFYPDIIVHKRGSNCFNLLIIEAKKTKDDDFDEEKLIAFTKPNKGFEGENIYNYELGAKIIFDIEKKYSETEFSPPVYFIKGKREEM